MLSSPLFPYPTLFRSSANRGAPGDGSVGGFLAHAPSARSATAIVAAAVHLMGLRSRAPRSELRRDRRDLPLEARSEEHTSELQSLAYLVFRLLPEEKK